MLSTLNNKINLFYILVLLLSTSVYSINIRSSPSVTRLTTMLTNQDTFENVNPSRASSPPRSYRGYINASFTYNNESNTADNYTSTHTMLDAVPDTVPDSVPDTVPDVTLDNNESNNLVKNGPVKVLLDDTIGSLLNLLHDKFTSRFNHTTNKLIAPKLSVYIDIRHNQGVITFVGRDNLTTLGL